MKRFWIYLSAWLIAYLFRDAALWIAKSLQRLKHENTRLIEVNASLRKRLERKQKKIDALEQDRKQDRVQVEIDGKQIDASWRGFREAKGWAQRGGL